MKYRPLQPQRDFVGRGFSLSGGAIAQLGERLNGIQEVSGSIPLSSTRPGFLLGRPGFSLAQVLGAILWGSLLCGTLACHDPETDEPASPEDEAALAEATADGGALPSLLLSDGGLRTPENQETDGGQAGPNEPSDARPDYCNAANTHEGNIDDTEPWDQDAGVSIQCVVGNFQLKETSLRNLNLPDLSYVSGNLVLYENHILDHFEFPNLVEVGGELYVGKNTNLKSFSLPNLMTTQRFTVVNNENLETLDQQPLLETTHGVIVQNHAALTHMDFPSLNEVAGTFFISSNALLADISADELATVTDAFEIQSNAALLHLSLPLSDVGGYFRIYNNALLERITLEDLIYVGGDLVVAQNPNLPTCEVDAWVEELQNGGAVNGSIDVSDNNNDEECP